MPVNIYIQLKMANCGAEFRAVEASGIPSEVFVFLAACGVGRLKISVWKFHKSEKGYGLSLFWRTGEGRPDTLIMPTTHLSMDDLSRSTVRARGSSEARSECRSSCKGNELEPKLNQGGLMLTLLEFQKCQLLAKEGVKSQNLHRVLLVLVAFPLLLPLWI